MTRRTIAVASAVAAALVLAGCTSTADPGKPSPAGTTSASSPPVSSDSNIPPYAGAPKVPNPLSSNALAGGPCAALTPAQVKDALGIDAPGKPDTLPGVGPKCVWDNLDSGGKVTVYFGTETGQGLSGLYANTKPKMAVWKELPPIQGFPAVAYSDKAGTRSDFCQVDVGVTDKISIAVGVFLREAKIGTVDPCTVAPLEANDVVTTLRQKAGG